MRSLSTRSCRSLACPVVASCEDGRQSVHGLPGRSLWRRLAAACRIALFILLTTPLTLAQNTPTSRVGLPITLTDIYIPGGEAKPKPRPNREPPIVVRLLEVKPAQDGKRYDFEIYGLDAGTYDLATYLEAVDPANPPRFAKIPITITTELPPGLPRPGELVASEPEKVGGYKTVLWILAILWLLGLLALILWRRGKVTAIAEPDAPLSLAERLRALLTSASRGDLDDGQKANLERLILGHWRQRLPEIASLSPADGLSTLRHHDEAGPLLLQLEKWLHAKDGEVSEDQIDELLAPYRSGGNS